MKKYKILSIDGGGIKGILPCTILKAIVDKTGSPVSELFNLVAGTSTGGIIALGLSVPNKFGLNAFTAADMLDLYKNNGKDIFSKRQKDLWSRIGSWLDKTEDAVTKNYEAENFEKLLKDKFADVSLSKSLVNILITTYDIYEGKPFYFSSRLAKEDAKEDILMRAIARSTSAAPTFFEPSLLKYNKDQDVAFVDGGVFANNPSILAFAEAKELWKRDNRLEISESIQKDTKGFYAVVTPDDKDLPFYMLSLGCGNSPSKINFSDAKKWRAIEWVKPLLADIFMRGVEESTDYTMRYLLPPYENGELRYQRLDMEIPREAAQMDNISKENIDRLIQIANDFVKANDETIKKICENLV